jgi:predicted phage terminase large subunit-like protein
MAPQTQDAALIEAVRSNFIKYIPAVHRLPGNQIPYPAPHHQVWAQVLQDDSLGHTCIIAPPSHAKTNVAGVYYPAWYVGNHPSDHFIYISSTAPQAVKQSIAVRDTITDNPRFRAFFPEIRPDKSKGWGQEKWYVRRASAEDKDPTFKAAGVGGDILGARADRMLLDDVMDEENSATAYQREKVANWIGTTAMSRIVPKGRCVCIMTRWHEEDLADWCRKTGFAMVHMPALSDDTDVYATIKRFNPETGKDDLLARILVHQNGPALWPQEWPVPLLEQKRVVLGPNRFAQMYQGVPVPAGGAIFQESWWQYWSALPPMSLILQTIDTAFQEKQNSDYSVIQTWGLGLNGKFYLLDQWRKRVSFPDLKNAAFEQYKKWKPSQVIIEERASGQSLIQELRQERDGFPSIPVLPYKDQNRDKVMRANSVAGYFESGVVQIPRDDKVQWDTCSVGGFKSEMQFFPAGAHDDQVDCAVMAVSRLANYASPPLPDTAYDAQETFVGNVWGRQF